MNNPVSMADFDGKDAILIVFPDYKVEWQGVKWPYIGHAGILLIDNKTGVTKYYEYGRYYSSDDGHVVQRTIPNVTIDENGEPTNSSLNKVLGAISRLAGHNGRIEGAYVESDEFNKMNEYAKKQKSENKNSKREKYGVSKNCGTFARDVIDQDPTAKDEAPWILDIRPNNIVKEYQDVFRKVQYNPEKHETTVQPKEEDK